MALNYCSSQTGGVQVASQDPNSVLDYTLLYKPNLYIPGIQYSREDVVLPTVFSGFYLECIDSGIADSVEPTWPTDKGEIQEDNTVTWKTREYSFYLDIGEGIEVDGMGGYLSTWTATNGVTIGNEVANDRSTKTWILSVPTGIKSTTLTNRITTTSGRVDERSIIVKFLER